MPKSAQPRVIYTQHNLTPEMRLAFFDAWEEYNAEHKGKISNDNLKLFTCSWVAGLNFGLTHK